MKIWSLLLRKAKYVCPNPELLPRTIHAYGKGVNIFRLLSNLWKAYSSEKCKFLFRLSGKMYYVLLLQSILPCNLYVNQFSSKFNYRWPRADYPFRAASSSLLIDF